MAGRELLGNLDTSNLVTFAIENRLQGLLDTIEFAKAREMAGTLFSKQEPLQFISNQNTKKCTYLKNMT
jgi:hypothetical protein